MAPSVASISQNSTAIGLMHHAPTAFVGSISYAVDPLRPYDQPVVLAIELLGMIYMLIFAFIVTMANAGVRAMM